MSFKNLISGGIHIVILVSKQWRNLRLSRNKDENDDESYLSTFLWMIYL